MSWEVHTLTHSYIMWANNTRVSSLQLHHPVLYIDAVQAFRILQFNIDTWRALQLNHCIAFCHCAALYSNVAPSSLRRLNVVVRKTGLAIVRQASEIFPKKNVVESFGMWNHVTCDELSLHIPNTNAARFAGNLIFANKLERNTLLVLFYSSRLLHKSSVR